MGYWLDFLFLGGSGVEGNTLLRTGRDWLGLWNYQAFVFFQDAGAPVRHLVAVNLIYKTFEVLSVDAGIFFHCLTMSVITPKVICKLLLCLAVGHSTFHFSISPKNWTIVLVLLEGIFALSWTPDTSCFSGSGQIPKN